MKIHFIGIGGIGISALAKFMAGEGHTISGSDIRQSEITDELALKFGAKITIPHHGDAVDGADMVIHSAAVRKNNPEYLRAKALGIPLYARKEALKFILKDKKVYAVGGAHGKSTTSAMLAELLPQSNAIIGAISKAFHSNVRTASNDEVVFEADESDASFLNCNPYMALLTNVEPEHMEYYEYDLDRFYGAYEKFLSLAKVRVINAEDPFLSGLSMESVKLYPSRDIRDIEYVLIGDEPHTRFRLKDLGLFDVFGIGEHIALDAALAILAALHEGQSPQAIRENLRNYKGIKKRFDIIENRDECVVIDDYGHHPTEIKATMDALRHYAAMRGFKKIRAIWQPHKYSRTMDNLQGFVDCFSGADELVILPIWAAGEVEVPIDLKGAFSGYELTMAEGVTKEGGAVKIVDAHGQTIRRFDRDLIVAFGAGDITYQIRGLK
ncbi:UDP-N-acetylmuramate--L-alanine ligase [Hydrogenimonas cancrithermarum]|uniref:UDP-N-acetylmuramate--L-alanine ligase n=1 Tax=Hydrogenimonas cancrithermarum TaxID=2993563 RepID=A0ABN6WX16_9BACT|nr:UDP-N-acetylmuramate--L-alanine ligase [Hydrogenimonas cancrithermarum]BDY13623.1 UDP-N-acetylmuramate--L-alanine ligase [Hydrogenimonas cancrithermarum]